MLQRMTSVLLLLTWSMQLGAAQSPPAAAALDVAQPTTPVEVHTTFRVRYVNGASVYVEGGRSGGLTEGTHLVVRTGSPSTAASSSSSSNDSAQAFKPEETSDDASGLTTIAELKVVAVAETSAVCEVVSSTRPLVVGDIAMLPQQEIEKLVEKRTLGNTRNYPAVVSFTEGDPMDEDVRDAIPRPPLPEVNRAQGRIGLDFSTIHNGGTFGSSSTTTGVVLRADITRINGTHWNLNGYWRGGLTSTSSRSQPTLQDLLNRTYTMSLTYQNPDSHWVAGMGRLYLPWASSLNSFDGGYFGRRTSERVTAGIFGGLANDPTSLRYDPNRRIAGGFTNISGGSYDDVHYSSTVGAGVGMLKWSMDRPFVFTENTIDYKRVFSVYEALLIDRPRTGPGVPPIGGGVASSFITFRVQPHPRISFDFNHSYFRDVPTYDPQLVGTGLLDKYLFQGFSAGARVEAPAHITLYTQVGRSNVSSDPKASWNTMYGITLNRLWKTGIRLDARYSNFNSPFAQGDYRSVTVSRSIRESFQFQVQAGLQKFISPVSKDNGSRFLNASGEFFLGRHYFFDTGFTVTRGSLQNYNQVYSTLGYRFDNRWKRETASATQK
jgi:hypothetical protein